ncbi:serine/threonine-protein kinase/endoribonuclease IRE1-like [Lycorma delicatula]|uniref:serine/threonine-protein kinase/endoribonuclease IRE1-like n=1 Tax=Lycorma delicatula TaxID=130591 RepID=UPI003F513B8D
MRKVNLIYTMVWLFVLFSSLVIELSCSVEESWEPFKDTTSLIKEEDLAVIVLSTLDGSLIGIDKWTGDIRWKLSNEPAVKVPIDVKNAIMPMFLPDPKDGSLYMLGKNTNELKKLPFTIQQLVASSPCRSSDGIFYTGKKIDSWFQVNWKTGRKQSFVTFDQLEKTCPAAATDHVFIGRTEYSLIMHDSKKHGKHWNITFFDYAAQSIQGDQLANYELVHFSGSSSGRVATFDRRNGALLWEQDYGSPVVALYSKGNQDLVSIPFTSLEETTLDRLPFSGDKDKLYPTLYIGEHRHGLYALPSLVGGETAMLSLTKESRHLLLEGPSSDINDTNEIVLLLGHYQVPDYSATRLQIAGRSDKIIPPSLTQLNGTKGPQRVVQDYGNTVTEQNPVTVTRWADSLENKALTAAVLGLIISVAAMFLYFRAQVREFQQLSQHSSRGSNHGSQYSDNSFTEQPEVLPDGTVRVGKITFHMKNVLGKGCEGTFVFRGEFDGRAVAVKRLLPECFTVADREVCLLRESDMHANVVRYFCTEQDKQFRYIALELCAATLQDYVEKNIYADAISESDVLHQATSGLEHLHSLNIVHRDIKPHNVLLSVPSSAGKVRAMISDFGLCKKLQIGRASFSRRSGITGTDGWIAPEMVLGNGRTMCAVDIFSLGCVFYYVKCGGKHPFGDPLRRQANILSGDYKLTSLKEKALWYNLIKNMISSEPLERPPATVIKYHPVFWDKLTVLSFLQDVSDRMEKEDCSSAALITLETGGDKVCGSSGDWRDNVDAEITADLRKYRTYRGESVRDLLRALRNKKHHFRELSEEAQRSLGPSADTFVDYWLDRFPTLFSHSWTAMQCVRHEPEFAKYYQSDYTFPPVITDCSVPGWLTSNIMENCSQKIRNSPKHNSPRRKNNYKQEFRKSKQTLQCKVSPDNNEVNDLVNSESCTKDCKQIQFQYNKTVPDVVYSELDRCSNVPLIDNNVKKTSINKVDVEMEQWKQKGMQNGVWRPKSKQRSKQKKDNEEAVVWVLPS